MKKKAKTSQGKRTRGAPRRQQIPTQDPSPAPSWIRPWVLTLTKEYDERTVSAADYDKNEEWCRWNGITPRTEEGEEEYNLFLQQEFYELGARNRECAAVHAEANRFSERVIQEESERRNRIAAKAARKRAKKEAEGRAEAERQAAAQREAEQAEVLRRRLL